VLKVVSYGFHDFQHWLEGNSARAKGYGVKGFLLHHKYVTILRCFIVGRGWTPRDELYGIADQLIDPGLGLHGPIGILELSTFDLRLCMIIFAYSSPSVTGLYKFLQVLINYSLGFSGWSDFCFTPKMWRSSVHNIIFSNVLLWDVGAHFMTSCMALQTNRSIPVSVCTS
jgi:hypothetical protein